MTAICKRYPTKLVLYGVANELQGDSVASPCWLVLPGFFFVSVLSAFFPPTAHAQERPYFVSYDHYFEEPGNLDIENFSTYGIHPAGNNLFASWFESEIVAPP